MDRKLILHFFHCITLMEKNYKKEQVWCQTFWRPQISGDTVPVSLYSVSCSSGCLAIFNFDSSEVMFYHNLYNCLQSKLGTNYNWILTVIHCPKNNLNLQNNTKPFKAGGNESIYIYIWLLFTHKSINPYTYMPGFCLHISGQE